MKEITLSEAMAWSIEVSDPLVTRPTDEEWRLFEAMIKRGSWTDIPGVSGEEPKVGDLDVPMPTSRELIGAPIGLIEIFDTTDLDSYNYKSPPDSAVVFHPDDTIEIEDLHDW